MERFRANLLMCAGTSCVSCGTMNIRDALKEEIKNRGLEKEIKIVLTGCNGYCAQGPVMVVQPEGIFYQSLTVEEIPKLVEEHFLKGRPYQKLMFKEPEKKIAIPTMNEIPFFKHQVLRVLRNRGLIDPEALEEYIARDGYQAAAKALSQMTSGEIVKVVKDSGLRGRGGAGFPTGLKWELALRTKSDMRYVVCNGDEGDPGAFMDRSVMEADPHSVIEGMIICAKAIESRKGYIYVRSEYPLAVKRLQIAIDHCYEAGLLGKNILGTGVNFDLKIYQGAGAFVCGEETALMRSIEGKRGIPRARPPFPVHQGLWDQPTVLNNVETFANIPPIILNGADWFSSLGTDMSKGTKVFALTGRVKNTGLIEVPLGISLKKIIYDIGGGIESGRSFKAVQTGGPSGGCIPEKFLDLEVDYESLAQVGSIMGSGGMVVLDETDCMVNTAKFFLEFTQAESCGKCIPCRIGTKRLLEILNRVTSGNGKEGDVELLEELGQDIKATSLCGLGLTAPNPVLSTIRYFRNEYEAHIKDKKCPAAVCKELLIYSVLEEFCNGCGACKRACPADAITGKRKKIHKIDSELCVKCGTCFDVCKFNAIKKQ
ncbi:MAG: NADH-quinone oxidoreductase subunit NuoF [Nitrospirota bacterium]|nr:NADH-quinone oxidoreductase subunit NuoF [Nitrospirota bacterium]MDH5768200.1 NADH-quinone oxidoreductase subunit NuoF [Nitrospirota bacterium]